MGITALNTSEYEYTDSKRKKIILYGIRVNFRIDPKDTTNSSDNAEKIIQVLFRALSGVTEKIFDPMKNTGKRNFFWRFYWTENETREKGYITQPYGGHSITYFINLPERYTEDERNVILIKMKRRLGL